MLSAFVWILGDAGLAIGMTLGIAGLAVLRRSSQSRSEACSRWEFDSLAVCAMCLLLGAALASVAWYARWPG